MSDQPIVDAHHHVWRVDRTPWLQGPSVPRIFGSYEAIKRDYPLSEYAAEAGACGVAGSVYVQINVGVGREAEEVSWIDAEASGSGLMGAVTAFADLNLPDVADTLDRLVTADRVRAIRQQLHWHQNPAYRFASGPTAMLEESWLRGLAEVGRRGLHFELQVFPSQLDAALAVVDRFPEITFVLLHAGMPDDRTKAAMRFWRSKIVLASLRPNVVVKLSGLGTFVRRCEFHEWAEVIVPTIDAFGPERCMFGSNFPIEKLWTDYATLIGTFCRAIDHLTVPERHRVLYANAVALYRLSPSANVKLTQPNGEIDAVLGSQSTQHGRLLG